jgi:hypothetical protein
MCNILRVSTDADYQLGLVSVLEEYREGGE